MEDIFFFVGRFIIADLSVTVCVVGWHYEMVIGDHNIKMSKGQDADKNVSTNEFFIEY